MTLFSKLVLSFSLAATLCAGAGASPVGPRNFDISRFSYKNSSAHGTSLSAPARMAAINKINSSMTHAEEAGALPTISFTNSDMIGDIDGPDNELWFYTSSMVYKNIEHEYYTEYVLLEYSFDIYDAAGKFVGSIHDKMRYGEYEVRTVACNLVPTVTKNFFNDDNRYELMIGLAVNRSKLNIDGSSEWLPNNYRTVVYSLGGDKESLKVEDPQTGEMVTKEFDSPVFTIQGSLGDVLDASTPGHEEIYLTLYDEELPDYTGDDVVEGDDGLDISDDFWENLTKSHISLKICGKVGADGKMSDLFNFDIPILSMPGNQESTPFLMSFTHNDKPYFLIQYYKDIFFNRYDSATDDMSMRENNSLMIDIYAVNDGTVTKTSSTEIPFVKDSKDRLLFSFHSVGDFRFKEDINFDEAGPATFFITKNNYFADESSEYSYYYYGKDGKKIHDIFEGAQSNLPMTNIDGLEPQQMFVTYYNGEYFFNFVDLLSGKQRASFSCYLETDPDADPDMMTSNIDRLAYGDSYRYAVEMRTPTIDENENTIMRIGWLDENGKYLRFDEVNMGQYVIYAQCYIDGYTLRNDFYLDDEPHEYMMLIKRGLDTTSSQEELLIGQAMNPAAPEGKDVLRLTPNDNGNLYTINPYTMLEKPMLHVYYYDQETQKTAMDIYYLPFYSSAIKDILADDSDSVISFDGEFVAAPSADIKVFDIQGRLVRSGSYSVKVDDLAGGMYIALVNGMTRKILVK